MRDGVDFASGSFSFEFGEALDCVCVFESECAAYMGEGASDSGGLASCAQMASSPIRSGEEGLQKWSLLAILQKRALPAGILGSSFVSSRGLSGADSYSKSSQGHR